MDKNYNHELLPILHRILDVSAQAIHLEQVPNWPRDSLPKSPIVQKLGLIVIPIFYPWWSHQLEIEYEQFGPYSPVIASVFEEMLEQGQCIINENYLEVGPPSFEEQINFPEITELFIQKLLSNSVNPILTQFEMIELFSIIAVEQEELFRSLKILRRMTYITDEQKKRLLLKVIKRMIDIPHLQAFIQERGTEYAKNFVAETIEAFYEAISLSGEASVNN